MLLNDFLLSPFFFFFAPNTSRDYDKLFHVNDESSLVNNLYKIKNLYSLWFSKSSQTSVWACSQIFLLKMYYRILASALRSTRPIYILVRFNFCNLFLGGSYNLNSSSNTAVSSLECNLHKAHFPLRKEEPCDHQCTEHGYNHRSVGGWLLG